MVLTPAFGALERSLRSAATPPSMPAAPGSMTGFLSFSDRFADFFEHGAAAPISALKSESSPPAAAVNRSAGLQLIIIGPWRSLTPQRPFSRRSPFTTELVMGALGGLALVTVAASTLLTLSPLFGSAGIGLGFGTYPLLRLVAVLGFLVLLSAGTTSACSAD